LPNVELKLVGADGREVPPGEIGEICVKTPVMIESYLDRGAPEELLSGFFATGDIGRLDEDGFLYIVDRKKDMIISGGVNIYPAEIENALRAHPGVFDVAVFGAPHPEWGEEVRAVVECVDGHTVTEEELLAFVKDDLAAYKRPRGITFMRELPRNAAGKVLKTELRAPFWKRMGTPI
jgi:acyl-CoA synthetase (AMP-forming)/AMP-acid ligase II